MTFVLLMLVTLAAFSWIQRVALRFVRVLAVIQLSVRFYIDGTGEYNSVLELKSTA